MPPINRTNPPCPECSSPTRKSGKDKFGRQRYQCRACRRVCTLEPKFCVVCGGKIPRDRLNGNTCSEACWTKKRRGIWIDHYYRAVASDPDYNKKRHQEAKKRPGYAEYMSEGYKRRWQRIKSNPERLQLARDKAAIYYSAHAKEIQEKRKKRFENLSPEKQAARKEHLRRYGQEYWRKKTDVLRSDPIEYSEFLKHRRRISAKWKKRLRVEQPERYQKLLQKKVQDRIRRRLMELLAIGEKLKERANARRNAE